jgi:hypothetical protein
MILLSIKAGLRACEIAGLDWSMVLDAQGHVSGTINVRDASMIDLCFDAVSPKAVHTYRLLVAFGTAMPQK